MALTRIVCWMTRTDLNLPKVNAPVEDRGVMNELKRGSAGRKRRIVPRVPLRPYHGSAQRLSNAFSGQTRREGFGPTGLPSGCTVVFERQSNMIGDMESPGRLCLRFKPNSVRFVAFNRVLA